MKYITIPEIIEGGNYPFTKGQIRSLLMNRDKNGLSKAVRKIGKRLYVRTDLFDLWIESYEERENG